MIEKYVKWKKVVERKDLTMNVQTKDKQLLDGNRGVTAHVEAFAMERLVVTNSVKFFAVSEVAFQLLVAFST